MERGYPISFNLGYKGGQMNTLEEFYEYAGNNYDKGLFEKTFLDFNSDKSGYHNYHVIYERLFSNREEVQNVLEMGIHMGASLKAWKKLFPKANIIGLENNQERFFTEDRILSMYVDQSILSTFDSFNSLMRGTEFEFIVDDGSHFLQETKNTFNKLLPALKINGWFVVEDIRKEFESEWENISNSLPNNYKSFLINMTHLAKTNGEDNIVLVVRRIS